MAAKLIVEYRKNQGSQEWIRSYKGWTQDDVDRLNKIIGYDKYRTRMSTTWQNS